jgi:hypothetical protein
MRISPRIQLPDNFYNRVIKSERNTHNLPLLCLLQWETKQIKKINVLFASVLDGGFCLSCLRRSMREQFIFDISIPKNLLMCANTGIVTWYFPLTLTVVLMVNSL